jgi:hypothetical protein
MATGWRDGERLHSAHSERDWRYSALPASKRRSEASADGHSTLPPSRKTSTHEAATGPAEAGPTITATLADGPLEGRSIEVEVVEGRPPKIIDVPVDDGRKCRYCLADWVQTGSSAVYTFLYRV